MDQEQSGPDSSVQSYAGEPIPQNSDPHCHLFANMRYGYLYCQVVFDKTGRAVDFIHKEYSGPRFLDSGLRC